MSTDGITRVNYFDRQFLRLQDFADEQAYHVEMRWRHNLAGHAWGILDGLELKVDEGSIFVQPGMAVDGYGRELVLQARRQVPALFDEKGTDTLDVWLSYAQTSSDRAPPGYAACGATTEAPFYRWQEVPILRVEVPDPAFPVRRRPEAVPEADLDFEPSRIPFDSPRHYWPVFLGQIRRDPANAQQPYTVDLSDRPYAGLRGGAIVAPSGSARVQLGAEASDDPRRFAVFIPALASDPRLEIDAAGAVTLRGRATVYGDLSVDGAVEFGVGTATSRQPWRIYRVAADPNDPSAPNHELRVEMAAASPGGVARLNRVVFGAWSEEEKRFHPCVTIADDCTVTVHGNLKVEGLLTEAVGRAQVSITREARGILGTGLLSGVSGANVLIGGPGASFVPAPGLVARPAGVLTPEGDLEAAANFLVADPSQLTVFVDLLQSRDPGLVERLRSALPPEPPKEGGGS